MPRHGKAIQRPLLDSNSRPHSSLAPPLVTAGPAQGAAAPAVLTHGLDESREVGSSASVGSRSEEYSAFAVQTLTGQKFHVTALKNDSVANVKKNLHLQSGIPAEKQRILVNGLDLSNEELVANCGIANGDTVSLCLKMDTAETLDPALAELMEKHGLTGAEQRQLHGEGVVDIETFAAVREQDFVLSGIDINMRRRQKLRGDLLVLLEGVEATATRCRQAQVESDDRRQQIQAMVAAAHQQSIYEQTQALLDEAGLSVQGRDAARSLCKPEALRQLQLADMANLGLNLVDRRKLETFCRSERVRRAQEPICEEVLVEGVRIEDVATEAEWSTIFVFRSRMQSAIKKAKEIVRAPREEQERQQSERIRKAKASRRRKECFLRFKVFLGPTLMLVGGVMQQVGVWLREEGLLSFGGVQFALGGEGTLLVGALTFEFAVDHRNPYWHQWKTQDNAARPTDFACFILMCSIGPVLLPLGTIDCCAKCFSEDAWNGRNRNLLSKEPSGNSWMVFKVFIMWTAVCTIWSYHHDWHPMIPAGLFPWFLLSALAVALEEAKTMLAQSPFVAVAGSTSGTNGSQPLPPNEEPLEIPEISEDEWLKHFWGIMWNAMNGAADQQDGLESMSLDELEELVDEAKYILLDLGSEDSGSDGYE
jgi:hypothetical protein